MTIELVIVIAAASLAAICPAAAADADALRELAPTGTLRIGVAYGPIPTPVFAVRDSLGEVRGVPRDLTVALATSVGLPFAITSAATTGELTEACATGTLDVAVMPIDDERRKRLDFSPPYFVIESTFLAAANSSIESLKDVDRPGITVVGIAGSTTFRAAGRSLTAARLVAAPSIDEALAIFKSGDAQALALTHDGLPPLQRQLPGSRILDGAYQTTGVAIAVPKDRPKALAAVSAFVEAAKRDGTLRRIFDAAGLTALSLAP